MGGHLDDAEHCLDAPIVSLSLGLSGLFLIGGRSKAAEPSVVLLRSGDLVVMSGASRLCYHGVPALLSPELERVLCPGGESALPSLADVQAAGGEVEAGAAALRYLSGNRLNLNSRQVRRPGEGAWVDRTGSGYVET